MDIAVRGAAPSGYIASQLWSAGIDVTSYRSIAEGWGGDGALALREAPTLGCLLALGVMAQRPRQRITAIAARCHERLDPLLPNLGRVIIETVARARMIAYESDPDVSTARLLKSALVRLAGSAKDRQHYLLSAAYLAGLSGHHDPPVSGIILWAEASAIGTHIDAALDELKAPPKTQESLFESAVDVDQIRASMLDYARERLV